MAKYFPDDFAKKLYYFMRIPVCCVQRAPTFILLLI